MKTATPPSTDMAADVTALEASAEPVAISAQRGTSRPKDFRTYAMNATVKLATFSTAEDFNSNWKDDTPAA